MGGERERDVLVTHIATCSCCTGKKPTQSKERIHTYTAKKKFRKLKFVCHAKMIKGVISHILFMYFQKNNHFQMPLLCYVFFIDVCSCVENRES